MAKSARERIFEIIQPAREGDRASEAFDFCLLALIIINSVIAVAETFDLNEYVTAVFGLIDLVSIALFTIEYLFRIVTADLLYPELGPVASRLRYMFSLMGLIDLMSILPFYLPHLISMDLRTLRMLRLFRLLRILKLGNYLDGLAAIGLVIKDKKDMLLSSCITIAILMMVASVMMYYIEGEAQPDVFSNAFDALWWAVCTLTTVGYGDVYPISDAGRLLSTIIALLGIGLVAVPTGIIASGFTEQLEEKKSLREEAHGHQHAERQDPHAIPGPDTQGVACGELHAAHAEWHYCPHCGQRLDP